MNRPLFLLIVLAGAIAACSQSAEQTGNIATATPAATTASEQPNPSAPGPSPTSSASSVASARPTSRQSQSPEASRPSDVLAADGIGPYLVGSSLSQLQSRGLVANLMDSANCDASFKQAEATGHYAGKLSLAFSEGMLTDVATASNVLVTPSGARVGMSVKELETIYGSRARRIDGVSGNRALSVRVAGTDLGVVFYLDATNTRVDAIAAGQVERLEQAAVVGEGC
jgi:hypothetical protein